MNTQELHKIIYQDTPNYLEELTPLKEYTEEEIEKATYIYINPDDQTWELGFENPVPVEAYENFEANLTAWKDLPIFIY